MRVDDEAEHRAVRRSYRGGDDAVSDIADRAVLARSAGDRVTDSFAYIIDSPVRKRAVARIGVG